MMETESLRILLADDDPFVLGAILDFMELLGHETLAAENGRQAAQLFDRHGDAIDLLITDICMPEVDGLGLIRHVRGRNDVLPIIVITGFAEHDALERIAALDIPVFTKPLSFAELQSHLPTAGRP